MLITDITPFHPLDYNWPDQPGDKGIAKIEDKNIPITECLIAAIHNKTGEFLLDQEIKISNIKRNDLNWYFVVVHIIDSAMLDCENLSLLDKEIYLQVDDEYRYALSKSHTACHLAALALNKVTAKFWKKSQEFKDSLGNPSLDKEAILLSKISENDSVEYYRCGKTLRKKGFDSQLFLSDDILNEVECDVNKQLSEWCNATTGLEISISAKKSFLHELRQWHCLFLDGREAIIPCGGTHINTINSNDKIAVSLQKENENEFKMISKFVSKNY